MTFKAADGPGRFEAAGGEVVFQPLKRLPARGDVVYKVTLTATGTGPAASSSRSVNTTVSTSPATPTAPTTTR